MSEFSIARLDIGNGIKVAGELDVATAPRLTAVLDDMASHCDLVLDLSEVTFLDSHGVRSILALSRGRNGNGPIVIRPSPAVIRLFEILALEDHPGIELQVETEPPARSRARLGSDFPANRPLLTRR